MKKRNSDEEAADWELRVMLWLFVGLWGTVFVGGGVWLISSLWADLLR
ncbi:MAG TPA: hypothetical protein VF306_23385 [Pirellulales bacterium]